MTDDEQHRLVLTPHPLQRIGAYSLARLAGTGYPGDVTPMGFSDATERMTKEALKAALRRDSKEPDGFWLKSSRSFFPNSEMNHPRNGKRDDDELRAGVKRWRQMPDQASWPGVDCVLCGRAAVRFFGKLDVPLAESHIYRNTTPRGHDGTALCWPCVCCFYALPYGCRLTGGPSIALHSWDEDFLRTTVSQRFYSNRQIMTTGRDSSGQVLAREVVGLDALRHYEEPVHAGVELLIVSNDNRGQSLDIYAMEQPVAEWLRKHARGRAYGALLRAHRTDQTLGRVGLARNAFREPERIVRAIARYLARLAANHGVIGPEVPALAKLTYSYVEEVMAMDHKDLAEIQATAGRVAAILSTAESGGKLNAFYSRFRDSRRLRRWLQHEAVYWAVQPANGDGPLVTTRGYDLLFDPGVDSQAWFHRELLLVAVLESLHERGWHPSDADQVAEELTMDPSDVDPEELAGDEGQGEEL